ncbi:MAG TPA: calcium-binding protein [Nitriliruptorales bacterium]
MNSRTVAGSITMAVIASLLVIPSPGLAGPPEVLAGFRTGLASLGTWAGDLAHHGVFAEPVPLTDLPPGDDDALDLESLFADAAGPWQSALADAVDELSDLEAELEDLATDTGDVVSAAVEILPEDGGVTTATFEVDVSVHHDNVPLDVIDPGSGNGLTTAEGDPGLPVTFEFGFDFTASFDDVTEEFWIEAEPVISYRAFIDADGDGTPDAFLFDDADFGSVVGMTQVEVLDGSTLSLDTHAALSVTDADGNGRLAFTEIAADGTLNDVGELTLPKSENIVVSDAAIDVAGGTLLLGLPEGITVLGGGAPAIDVTLEAGVVEVATNADFDTGIARFANIDTTELLGGLGQLSNMLEVVQRDPLVDVDMPFVDLLLSQMLGTTDDLKRFIVEHTNVDDEDTVLNEFGTATFATVQDFLTEVNTPGNGLSIDPAGVEFDPSTGYLELPINLHHEDGGLTEVHALLFDEVDLSPESVRIGRPALGDALEEALGITGLSAAKIDESTGELATVFLDGQELLDLPAPTALVDRALDVTIPWGVDLNASEACDPETCDLPETLEFEEAETLPPYRRFFVRDLADGSEFDLDIASSMDASDLLGSAGYVDLRAQPGSLIELGKIEPGASSLTIDLTYPPSLVEATGITRVNPFVFHFAYDPTTPVDGIDVDLPTGDFVDVVNNLAASATMNLAAYAVTDVIPILGSDSVPVELSWPALGAIADVQLAEPALSHDLVVTNVADPLVEALGTINFARLLDVPAPEDALFATIIDNFEGLGAGLQDVLSAGPLGAQIPFLAGTPGDLVGAFSALTDSVDELRNGELPDRLRDVLLTMEGHLGSVPGLELVDLPPLGGTDPDGVLDLVFDFSFEKAVDQPLSINTSELGGGLPSLAGVEAAGEVDVTGTAGATLAVPVALELTSGALPDTEVLVARASSVGVDVSAFADQSKEFTVSALGQELALGPGGEFRFGIAGSLGYDPAGPSTDTYVTLEHFGDHLVGDVGGTVASCTNNTEGEDAVPHVSDPDPAPDDSDLIACLNMPVFFNGAPATGVAEEARQPDDHWLQARWSDFGSIDVLHTPEDLSGLFLNELLSLTSFTEGISRLIDLISQILQGEFFGFQVPLLGDSLDGAAEIVDKLEQVKSAVTGLEVGPDGTDADALDAIRDAIDDALGPDGADLLVDITDPEAPGSLRVIGDCGGGQDSCDGSFTPLDVEAVEVALAIGGSDTGTEAFDLGLSGLDFVGMGGEVAAGADWHAVIGFGVSKDADFYLLDDPKPLLYAGGTSTIPELELSAFAGISDAIEARFGVLGFAVSNRDEADAEDVTVSLTGDVDGGGDGRITIAELVTSDPATTLNPVADITADLEYTLSSLGDLNDSIKGLPRVYADFDFDWTMSTTSGVGIPTIVLSDPAFDLGSALGEMFGPIFGRINNVVEVADDIRSFVFAPIPIISDLSRMFGGGDITFVDLAEIFGDVNLDFLKDVDTVIRFAKAITGLTASEPVPFADLIPGASELKVVFDPAKAQAEKPAPTQALSGGLLSFVDGDDNPIGQDDIGSLAGALVSEAAGQGKSGSDVDNVLGGGADSSILSLPIVQEPVCVLGMLAGGDCIIIDWTPRELYLGAEVEIPFGPFFGILYINIGGFVGAGIKFGMGFSTRGIRRAIERGGDAFASDPDAGIGNLIVEGIYIRDFEGPELYVNAGIYAEGEVNVVIAAAGVRGGIEATLGFDLIDGPEMDGLVYLDEMARRIHNPLCLFEVVGFLEAFLQIYVEIGPCPFCHEEEFELARVRLLDFTARLADCDKDPVLATEDGDVIRLNIGTRADPHRQTLFHIVDEQVVVRELVAPTPGGAPGRFSVSAFGFTQEYVGHEIWFNAGDGDDVLLFQGSKAGAKAEDDEDAQGPPLDEQQKDSDAVAPFTAKVTGFGGAGNDAITTGDGHDVIYGGDDPGNDSDPAETDDNGADQLTTGAGNDTVYGGPHDDQIDAGLGADTVYGEGGNDTINGGPGADVLLDGGPGNDRVDGGEHILAENGIDIIFPDGADRIAGGQGDDYLWGGPGDDVIMGDDASDEGDCTTGGSGGTDVIHGEVGSDYIYGGGGADVILGDETDAPEDGETYDDHIWGQGGGDLLVGAWHDDEIHGCTGADIINGSDGRDTIFGDAGEDRIFGDLWGSLGPITIGSAGSPLFEDGAETLPPVPADQLAFLDTDLGEQDRDRIDGGGGDDVIYGDGERDQIAGGGAADLINGGDGRDFIVGDDIDIHGDIADDDFEAGWDTDGTEDDDDAGDGNDVIFGGPGADEIYGEDGDDHVRGSLGDDLIFGNDGTDDLFGDVGEDEIYGGDNNDVIQGGPGDDLLLGNEDDDHLTVDEFDGDLIYGQAGNDRIIGGSGFLRDFVSADGGDALYGGAGTDVILGDNGEVNAALTVVTLVPAAGGAADGDFGDDKLVGDSDEDTLHGQDGDDDLYGGLADDQLFGELGSDELFGQNGHDYLVGDRGLIGDGADGAVGGDYRLAHHAHTFWPSDTLGVDGAPKWAVELQNANTDGAADILHGGTGDDHLYAGRGDDTLRGADGDDWMEGNHGRDTMFGYSDLILDLLFGTLSDDQDVMLGGSSNVNPETNKLDEGEIVMHGNFAEDVMLGDNGNVDRLVAGGEWAEDAVTGGHARTVELLDRERRDPGAVPPADLASVSGPDLMFGDGGNDRMWGEGGNDLVKGNAEDDQLQGNQGSDILEGNDGEDDLIGGTDLVWSGDDVGDPDDGDWLFGGADADVIAGDNAVITRLPVAGTHYYETDLIGVDAQRGVDPLDVAAFTDDNAGPDVIWGGSGVDALFGQDEPDQITGNGNDDYMEGNGAGDFLWGDLALPVVLDPNPSVTFYEPPDVFNAESFSDVEIEPIVNDVLAAALTTEAELSDDAGLFGDVGAPDGQDDQIGGWNDPGLRDAGDMVFGDGAQDFQLGDNGTLTRTVLVGEGPGATDVYRGFEDYRPDTFHRVAERFDVGDDDGLFLTVDVTSGDDWLQGDDEDDYQWGQDGDDVLFGDDFLDPTDVGNDDMLGELDDDTMFGGPGEDVMLGDRGSIDDTKLGAGVDVVADTQGPMFLHYEGLLEFQLDRRVNLLFEYPATPEGEPVPLEFDGVHHGGRDFMRGGPGHDSMHGGFGDDWMNGDGGADWLFGDYGDDAMWGGCGQELDPVEGCPDDPDVPLPGADETDALFNSYVDILLGGYGADVIDFRPRSEGVPGHTDEPIWRTITGLNDPDGTPDDDDSEPDQHHQGVDWIYGGWDRDVLQGDTGQNGLDFGDRLMDWTGAYNLYTRCNESYGDDGDVRQRSPMIEDAIWVIAFGSGVGEVFADVTTPGSSAFEELGFVYTQDNQENSGKAHDGTPGHFFEIECGDGVS